MKAKWVITTLIAATTILVPAAYIANAPQTTTPSRTEYVESEPVDTEPETYVENHGTSDCTSDCSGHEAGYEWAEKYTICDTEYDNGNSESFNEGVRAWAEDNCYYSDGVNPI